MGKETNHIVLDADRLRHLSGKRTAAAVRRWAKSQGIPVKESANGPWTTLEAVNQSLGLHQSNSRTYNPEEVL